MHGAASRKHVGTASTDHVGTAALGRPAAQKYRAAAAQLIPNHEQNTTYPFPSPNVQLSKAAIEKERNMEPSAAVKRNLEKRTP